MDINSILTTREAKINFLKGLIRIAKNDGITDERELVFYRQAALAIGLDEKDQEELDQAWEQEGKIEVSFEASKEKMFFFIQAVQLCWVDGEYVKAERDEIREIAKELCVNEEVIEEIEAWAYEGIVWNKKGEKLLELV